MGFLTAIDDFGSGNHDIPSMSTVDLTHVNTIKIDGSFVNKLSDTEESVQGSAREFIKANMRVVIKKGISHFVFEFISDAATESEVISLCREIKEEYPDKQLSFSAQGWHYGKAEPIQEKKSK